MNPADILTLPEYGFLRSVFLLSAMASVAFGLVGTFVVARRIGYLAGAISHCAFGGVGFGIWLQQTVAAGGLISSLFVCFGEDPQGRAAWINPVVVAIVAAVLSAWGLGVIQKYAREREDALIGILWSMGMAVGLLFLHQTTGYVSVTGWLFGDITLVSLTDLWTVGLLSAGVCLTVLISFHRLEAVCFDPEFARLRGIAVDFYYRLLLILVAVTVVLMIRIVGMVLVIAMLTIPASTASRLTARLGPMIFWTIFFCFLGSWLGLFWAVWLDWPAGPTIITQVALFYFLTVAFTKRRTADK